MVTDSELVNRLREILRTSDLNTTTSGTVRRQLEQDFGVDLHDRKKFISQKIDEILRAERDNNGAAGGNVDEERESGREGEEDNDGSGEGKPEEQAQEEDENEEGEEEEEEEEEEEGGGGEEEDDNDDDEEGSKGKASKKKRSKDEGTNKKKRGSGFTRICSISPQLQEFFGVSEMARTEVVKKLWEYIKANGLQDPKNKRNIKCDSKLHSIFRVDTINMFQMNKVLSKHIWPLEGGEEPSVNSPENSPPREKKQKRQKLEDVKNSKQKQKQQKGGTCGFLAPLQMSDALAKFLGTDETTIARTDVVKRIWDYIKQNQLQDPSDKRRILCDEKLKELFDVDTFNGFGMPKLLTAHLTKIER